MPRKGSKACKQDYKYSGVLYLDTDTYDWRSVVQTIKEYFTEYAFIVHDRDTTPDGVLKKAHAHWIGVKRTEGGKASPCSLKCVSDALGVPDAHVEYCKSVKASFRYLVHADSPDKAAYSYDEINTNMCISRYIKEYAEYSRARKILDIVGSRQVIRVGDIIDEVMDLGLYSEFRRGYAIWHTIIREHEEDFKNAKNCKR